MKAIEEETRRLKRLVADQALRLPIAKDVLGKRRKSPRRAAVQQVQGRYLVRERGAVGFASTGLYYVPQRSAGYATLCTELRALAATCARRGASPALEAATLGVSRHLRFTVFRHVKLPTATRGGRNGGDVGPVWRQG